jgi:hypothetical protein
MSLMVSRSVRHGFELPLKLNKILHYPPYSTIRNPRPKTYTVLCIFYNQRDATYTMFFIIISALRVSGGFSAHHQDLIKLYVQPWVLSRFPAVYHWCGCVGTFQL